MLNKFVYILFAISIIITFSACKGTNTTFPDEFISDESSDSNLDNSENSSSSTKQSSSSEDRDYSSSLASSSSLVSSSSVSESSSSIQSSNSKSSSSECIDTPAEIPSKKYDCSVYKCRSTAYLNPNVDYGELLDERDSTVYRTVKIGNQNWMAQNLAYDTLYSIDAEPYPEFYGKYYAGLGDPCPKGWRVPDAEDFDTLLTYVSNDDSKIRANACLWTKTGDDPLGFSLLPTGFYYSGAIQRKDCSAYLKTTFANEFGTSPFNSDACPGSSSIGYMDQGYALRCIEGETKRLSVTICNTDSTKCDYGTLTDERDGNTYKTIKYDYMEWMAENLHFAGVDTTTVKISCLTDNPDSCLVYGILYAIRDTSGICPTGWHIPSNDEWKILYNTFVKYASFNQGKAAGYDLVAESFGGKDLYGFSILLTRFNIGTNYERAEGRFYTSTNPSENGCLLDWTIGKDTFHRGGSSCKPESVRCVKNY